jgi:hypothetical protein
MGLAAFNRMRREQAAREGARSQKQTDTKSTEPKQQDEPPKRRGRPKKDEG